MIMPNKLNRTLAFLGFLFVWLSLAGCSTLPAFGPTSDAIVQSASNETSVSDTVVQYELIQLSAANVPSTRARTQLFPKAFLDQGPERADLTISGSDTLEIRIWEVGEDGLFASNGQRATVMSLDVSNKGTIDVPYAGRVFASGLTVQRLREELLERYKGQAIGPEISVRILDSSARTATIIGSVKNSKRFEIPPGGLTLLDVIADAGGVSDPTWEIDVTVTRGRTSATVQLEQIISREENNIFILPGDTVKIDLSPRRFPVFGAVSRPGNVSLDESTPSLATLLAETGGLDDSAAEPNSVFVFRNAGATSAISRVVPKVYRLDFARPDAFLLAQQFIVDSSDIVYVATADATEFRKFITTILSPAVGAAIGLQGIGN
jgi:polysaccharide export outer membrane protein